MQKVQEVVKVIKSILPKRRPIEHHEPFIDKHKASNTILRAIDDGIVGYDFINKFGEQLKSEVKTEHVILTSSGTAALEIALRAVGIKANETVLVPAATFIATANAVTYIGAIPNFIDGAPAINPEKLHLYLEKNSKQKNITGIVVVHLFGLPANMEAICNIAKEFNLKVIEDASQALGSYIDGKACGTIADIGVFSFNNNKIIVTGTGGAIVTNNQSYADRAFKLATTARIPHQWHISHSEVAWNYRMGNINAALGYSQIKNFARILASKRALASRYRHRLSHLVEFVESPVKSDPNYWLNTILVKNRDDLLCALHNESIKARAVFMPLHKSVVYQDHPRSHEVMEEADSLFDRGVCLPSGSGL